MENDAVHAGLDQSQGGGWVPFGFAGVALQLLPLPLVIFNALK